MEPTKTSRVFKWSLIAGIVIVLNLFFNYTLSLIYKEPDYVKFCPNEQVIEPITSREQCLAKGWQWSENIYPKSAPSQPRIQGYCDQQFTCRNDYEAARKSYDRNVFVTLVVLGVLSVIAGIFLKNNILLGQALSLAGVLSFIVASIRYWSSADNLLKVIILAVALVLLIWVALKKFRDQ